MSYELTFFLICLFLVGGLVLGITIPVRQKYLNTVQKAVNCNADMTSFIYKVALTKNEIVQRLQSKDVACELECELDLTAGIAVFTEYGSELKYSISFTSTKDSTLIRLIQLHRIAWAAGMIPMKLNSFFVQKLDAEMVSFGEYDEKNEWKPI